MDVAGFLVVATILVIAPGQDTVLVIRNSVTRGTSPGVRTAVGICCGLFVHATLSALGLSALLTASSEAYAILRALGAVYLIWLGFQSLRSALVGGGGPALESVPDGPERPLFREGLLSNLLNPKTATFYLALLPQFAVFPETTLRDSLFLASLHFLISLLWLGLIASVASRARALLASSSVRRSFDGATGMALVGFGVHLGSSEQ